MTLAVLLDAESEGTEAPVLLLGDGAALCGDQFRELVGQGLHLRRWYILARNEDVLVQRHSGSLRLLATRSSCEPPGSSHPLQKLEVARRRGRFRPRGAAVIQ